MINVDLQQLIRTLTTQVRRDLERSSERCVNRGGREVLVEDLLLALLEQPGGLLAKALADADVPMSELQATLQPRSEQSEELQWLGQGGVRGSRIKRQYGVAPP